MQHFLAISISAAIRVAVSIPVKLESCTCHRSSWLVAIVSNHSPLCHFTPEKRQVVSGPSDEPCQDLSLSRRFRSIIALKPPQLTDSSDDRLLYIMSLRPHTKFHRNQGDSFTLIKTSG